MALLDYHPLKVGRESIAGLNSVTLGLTGFVLLVSVYLFLESWMAKGVSRPPKALFSELIEHHTAIWPYQELTG